MSLDDINTITPLESDAVRSALKAIVINVATLVAVFTGKTFDVTFIQNAVDYGIPILVNMASIYYGYKALVGRINATKKIDVTKGVS